MNHPVNGSSDVEEELRLEAVGDIVGTLWVPAYQRGYRWGTDDVRLLLDDIWAAKDKDYCLQPVVVKRLQNGRYELVDGQQRLTTLFLIFQYMKLEGLQQDGPPFSIEYETRPRSQAFLEELDEDRKDDNVDFFHMYQAYGCIRDWFAAHGHRRQYAANRFHAHLFDYVKVIWYEAGGDVNSTALFTRVNVGRIPLTNAELVKALLLRRQQTQGAVVDEMERLRQIEIASQWDLIERHLQEDDFWAFLTNRQGQEYPTRIEMLFELLVGRGRRHDRFHTFFVFKAKLDDGRTREEIWEEVLHCYFVLREWHEDRDLFHRIGYLVTVGDSIATLLNESRAKTKSEFGAYLDCRIRSRLDLARDDLDELSYDQPEVCSRVLLLFNVETTRLLVNSPERYPFQVHKGQAWSLEHIHAQNAEALNRLEQWEEWLLEHQRALVELRLPDADATAQRDALIKEIGAAMGELTGERFEALSARVAEQFVLADDSDELHGIENLALLSSGANSALGNSAFEVKRRRILEMDRAGQYIPICTRRVFLKYYTPSGDQQMQFWSKQDRACYLDAMFGDERGVLTKYLKRGEVV